MWIVEFLDHRPLKEMEKQPVKIRAYFAQQVKLVEEYGPDNVGMPDIRILQGGLGEFRIRGPKNQQVRTIFSCEDKTVIILHVFTKKSNKIPQHNLKTARQRQKEIR